MINIRRMSVDEAKFVAEKAAQHVKTLADRNRLTINESREMRVIWSIPDDCVMIEGAFVIDFWAIWHSFLCIIGLRKSEGLYMNTRTHRLDVLMKDQTLFKGPA